jgi:hypothetical protein
MAEARLESEWDRTSLVVAKIHNVNCTSTAKMISNPAVINPLRRRKTKAKRMRLPAMKRFMMGE